LEPEKLFGDDPDSEEGEPEERFGYDPDVQDGAWSEYWSVIDEAELEY
jgi:hypothetical protein